MTIGLSVGDKPALLSATPGERLLVLVVMFVVALAVRLYGITSPPVDFHPYRQYRSALIARAYYLESLASTSAEERQIALQNQTYLRLKEPPITEAAAALL